MFTPLVCWSANANHYERKLGLKYLVQFSLLKNPQPLRMQVKACTRWPVKHKLDVRSFSLFKNQVLSKIEFLTLHSCNYLDESYQTFFDINKFREHKEAHQRTDLLLPLVEACSSDPVLRNSSLFLMIIFFKKQSSIVLCK